MAFFSFALICILFGSNFMLMDKAAQLYSPLEIGLGRVWGGAVVVWLMLFFSRQRYRLTGRTLGQIAVVAVLANAYPFAIQPWLIAQGTDHSFLAMFVPFTPLLTIVASVPMLGIRPTWQQIAGVVGGLGLLLWVMAGDGEQHGLTWNMAPIALTVPLSYAIGNTFLRRHLQKVPSIVLSSLLLTIAGTLLLPLAAGDLIGHATQTTHPDWASATLSLVLLGLLGTGACIGLFVNLVQQRGPLFAGMVTYIVPVVALGWGFVDGEYISLTQVLAIVGILAMVALVQMSQTGTVPEAARTASEKNTEETKELATEAC